jgi:5S rRNA maturation endonuclease (ribonuclease M5)
MVPLLPDLEVQLLQVVDVDGVGLRLKKYLTRSLSKKTIDVNEHLFLSSSISQSILAVSIENHILEPNQSTMVFVVDQKERVQ